MGTATGWSQYKVERKFIYPKAFSAGKPYSPGVLAGKTLYISGQVDKDPKTGAQPKGIAEQTRMAMANLGHVLRAAGMDYGNVVSCHVQLADMGQYKEMNEVYGSYFGPEHFPARTTLEFPGLPGGANVEISCIAYADKSKIALVVPPAGSIPPAMGPYRPGVWAGETLYVSTCFGEMWPTFAPSRKTLTTPPSPMAGLLRWARRGPSRDAALSTTRVGNAPQIRFGARHS